MNNTVFKDFLNRNLPQFANRFVFEVTNDGEEYFRVECKNEKIHITADSRVNAIHGFYCYLKKYCGVQLSWCGNRKIDIDKIVTFEGAYTKRIEQKYRVYLNYCTLSYSMCWWGLERWQSEIDFMAMNGINMTLAPVGSEAVLFETLIEFGYTREEALSCISSSAFWAWQLMTNIIGYRPPLNEEYVYSRLSLGKEILKSLNDFGIIPIQQGFSGHLPLSFKEKHPNCKAYLQNRWCCFDQTLQLDTLDPMFKRFGIAYLNKLKSLMGAYGYYACDPFHENAPPKRGKKYLNDTGSAIMDMYKCFDKNAVWVIQGWSLNYETIKNVKVEDLLVLDLNSTRALSNPNLKRYRTVAGMLHDFGGKNAMQGKLEHHCKNAYKRLKDAGVNAVGSGMFSEGTEQNPVVYELQFMLLCESESINLDEFIRDYITRRYSKFDSRIYKAWQLLLKTCYKSEGYQENEVGSALAARPTLAPKKAGPCCNTLSFYDSRLLEQALKIFFEASADFENSDGYQYDLCDLTRQVLSNRFLTWQREFAAAYKRKNYFLAESIAQKQKALLRDIDDLLSYRSEFSLDNRLLAAKALAKTKEEQNYLMSNLKLLITWWGDNDSTQAALHDYSWREWHGHISGYYYPRWDYFYTMALYSLKHKARFNPQNKHSYKYKRNFYKSRYDRGLHAIERAYFEKSENPIPVNDKNVIPKANELINKYLGESV